MQRLPEPELMSDPAQARAYAAADFSEPHAAFIERFVAAFPDFDGTGRVLDLGCGTAEITLRFAVRYPEVWLDGVDASPAMLAEAHSAIQQHGAGNRVRLIEAHLPGATLPERSYSAVISNSLLHHLRDPATLWAEIRRLGRPGSPFFVMDLRRPDGLAAARQLVRLHARGAAPLLRRDFFRSLLAAYRLEEVAEQLRDAGLGDCVIAAPGDRHLTVAGRLPA